MSANGTKADVFEMLRPLWWLIVVAGILVTIVASGIWRDMVIPLAMVSVAVQILIYGRITARLVTGRTADSLQILKEHGLNYVVAQLLIIAPVFGLRLLMRQFQPSAFAFMLLSAAFSAGIAVVTIYVFPLVFRYRKSVGALVAGVAYLRSHFAPVAWAAGIAAFAILLHGVGVFVFWKLRVPWSFGVLLASGVVLTGALAVSFAAALGAVLEGSHHEPESNA